LDTWVFCSFNVKTIKEGETVCLSTCIFILKDVFYHLVNMM